MKSNSFQLPDGRQLRWFEAGQGRPLVLLHGWAMSAAVFSELAALLSSDFRLLIPDLPGHGHSSPPLKADLETIAADLEAWLETAVKGPFALLGWSLGGMLALQIAARKLSPVDRLLLVATTPRFTQDEAWEFGLPAVQVRALARNLERRFEATLADFFMLAFAGEKISAERLRTIRTFAVRQSPVPERGAALGFLSLLAVHDQRANLAELHLPVLLLHGDLDQITPISAGRALAEMLPHGELLEFHGVGHCPFLSQPQKTAASILEFC